MASEQGTLDALVEEARELLNDVVDIAIPLLRVFFQAHGNYAGCRYTDSWKAEVMPCASTFIRRSSHKVLWLNV